MVFIMKPRRLPKLLLLLSLIGFVLLWAILTDAWQHSKLLFPNDTTLSVFFYAIGSRAIWIIPAIVLIVRFPQNLAINPKEMIRTVPHSKLFYLTISISLVYCCICMLVIHDGFWINAQESIMMLAIKFFVVGIVEEVVFRGWGYNALCSTYSQRKAVGTSTTLFVMLHWPAYIIRFLLTGSFNWSGILSQSAAALIWGIVCCSLLKKDRSIWSPILAHSFYDFVLTVFVG